MKRSIPLVLLPALLAASAAWAEDGGIPQMDPTWFPNQLLWLAISFVLLFVMVSGFIAPSISGVLSARETAIRDAIAQAELARAEAESTRGAATSAGQSARAKAAEIMAAAQAENSREAASELAKLDHELAKKAGHAEAVLSDAIAKAEAGVDAAARDLAKTIAAQLLGQPDATQASDGPKLKLAKR